MGKSSERVLSREQTFGGREKRQPNRRFELQAKDFTSTEQAVPIRVFWGTAKVAGESITPVFGLRSEPITTEAGK
jgi:hypothetical protein